MKDLFAGFDLNQWFESYLFTVNLDRLDRKSTQYLEMKKAFFAGIVLFIENIFNKDDTLKLEESELEKLLEHVVKQVTENFNLME